MLSRLRGYLSRPVAWGAVLLTYIGIIGAVAYAASVGATNADSIRAEQRRADTALMVQANQSRETIVKTGRESIRNSCQFDNRRTVELRGILRASMQGATPAQRERGRQFVRSISFRNCDKAAAVLTDNPREP